jgi:hypothetical protein
VTASWICGFEGGVAAADDITLTGAGSSSYVTSPVRTGGTGAMAYRMNPASSAVISFATGTATAGDRSRVHFGFRIATAPSSGERTIFGATAAGTVNIRLQSNQTLQYYINTTLMGTSQPLALNQWYWLGVLNTSQGSIVTNLLMIDGVSAITGVASTISVSVNVVGCGTGSEAAVDVYYDDVVCDDSALLPPSNIAILLPTSDNSVGSGWTLGSGGTTNLFGGVDNQPPAGVADTGATAQIRNAAANTNSYVANLPSYATVGVNAIDKFVAVQGSLWTGAPVATSAKSGTYTVTNPAIGANALAAGGTAGAFWSGVAAGTFPTGWKRTSVGIITSASLLTRTTAPTFTVTQTTSSTRIAMVCAMWLIVAWTPGKDPNSIQSRIYPQLLAQ